MVTFTLMPLSGQAAMCGEMQEAWSRRWRGWLIGGAAAGIVAALIALALVLQQSPPSTKPASTYRAPVIAAPLSLDSERALKPKDTFSECSSCPEMVVLPSGSFTMGSPSSEEGRRNDEGPQHRVAFDGLFAVGKFPLTFDEWDACAGDGGCGDYLAGDEGWGRGRRPAINVSWDDAKSYVTWLSRKTGKRYRLLSEAEYEYATRAGTETRYPWGDDIGRGHANCNGCDSQSQGKTSPAGSFAPNQFDLYDVVGNVWEWVEDCVHPNYDNAPMDGSAWTVGNCAARVIHGGSWYSAPEFVRSANRNWVPSDDRGDNLGFRVARTLAP